MRQAVAAVPLAVDLDAVWKLADEAPVALRAVLVTETQARANRSTTDWWGQQLAGAPTALAKRHWLFSVLSCAYTQVVLT